MPWIEFDNEGRVIDMDIRKSRRLYLEDYTLPTVFDYECPELEELNLTCITGFNEVTSDFPKLIFLGLTHTAAHDGRSKRLLGHFPSLNALQADIARIGEIKYGFPAYGGNRGMNLNASIMEPSTITSLMQSLPTVRIAGWNSIDMRGMVNFAGKSIDTLIDPTIATKKGWMIQLTSGDVYP